MKNTIILLIIVLLSFSIGLPILAQTTSIINTSTPCFQTGNCELCDFINIFIRASDLIVGLSGVLAVVMFVYGGFVLITSYGNEARIKWGKDVIIATIAGIFIVMLAWTMINFLIASLYGGNNDKWNACSTEI